jgi:hypothetical protein
MILRVSASLIAKATKQDDTEEEQIGPEEWENIVLIPGRNLARDLFPCEHPFDVGAGGTHDRTSLASFDGVRF